MRTLIISDIHQRVAWVRKCLQHEKYDKVVFLGDYFDQFYDNKEDALETAQFVKKHINDPRFTFIMGNHDLSYCFPLKGELRCSGFTAEKCRVISTILQPNDWQRMKFMHEEQGWYLSHAGMHSSLFCDKKTKKLNFQNVDEINHVIWSNLYSGERACKHVLPGLARGGTQEVGGVTWLDWSSEFKGIPNVNQIIGHSIRDEPKCRRMRGGANWNLDTNNRHIGWISDGIFSFEANKYLAIQEQIDYIKNSRRFL